MNSPVLENTALSRIGLGTAQFGLDYGVANRTGQTSPEEVSLILKAATESGVHLIDTAHLYGDAESVLGSDLDSDTSVRIVTKTIQFGDHSTISSSHANQLIDAYTESLRRLRRDRVYGLLVHSADDLLKPGGKRLWDAMCHLRDMGKARKIGVSVYNGEQIDRIEGRFGVEIVQVPANIFDQRLFESGHLQTLKRQRVEVHTRSAYLQGLLLMEPDTIPGYLQWARKPISDFQQAANAQGLNPLEACIDFALTAPYVDYTVIGVCNVAQFNQLAEAVARVGVRPQLNYSEFSITDQKLLNPSLWGAV